MKRSLLLYPYKRLVSLLACVGFFFSCLLFAVSSYGTETLSTGDFYPPYVDSRLPDNGLMVPLITEILDGTEDYFDIEIVYEPWARGYELTKEGRHLGTFPYVWDQVREQDFLYSDPIFDIGSYLFVRDELTETHWDIELLTKKKWFKVCRPNGYSVAELDKSLLSLADFELISPSDLPDCFRLLEKKRVDIVPIERMTGEFTVRQHLPDSKIKVFENAVFDASLFFIVSKQRDDADKIIAQFNQSLKAMRSSGQLKKYTEAFFSKLEVQTLLKE